MDLDNKSSFSDTVIRSNRFKHLYVRESKFENSDFELTQWTDCLVEESELSRSNFYLGRFRESGFHDSVLRWAAFEGAKFYDGCMFARCDLDHAKFTSAVLDEVDFSASNLTGVNFDVVSSMYRAQMQGVTGISCEQLVTLQGKWDVIIDSE